MSFISKILDAFKMESTREMENVADGRESDAQAVKNSEDETNDTKYNHDDYYANIAKQKENNLKATYDDVECYDLRPFDLNKPFISDGHFVTIELEGDNLEKAYKYLQSVHDILKPFKYLFENAAFPNKIDTGYNFEDSKDRLPTSHLRLQPYTATMKKNKYPFYLWLSFFGYYGTEYIYMIYFNKDGEIGKADLNLHSSNGARLSYESKIRRNENGLYVMRINKTLYVEPFGTKTIYHYKDNDRCSEKKTPKNNSKTETKRMSQYDIEKFAIECNAYMVREERKERQEQKQRRD